MSALPSSTPSIEGSLAAPNEGFAAAALLLAVRVGYRFIPGVAVVSAERGVRWSQVDQVTHRRAREFYSSMGSSLPFTYASYVWAKNRGVSRGVSAPYFGIGFHPLHGRNAFIFIPGVFCVTITSRGAIGICASPFSLFGFFFGGSIFVNHPALMPVTAPVLERLERARNFMGRVFAPVVRPLRGVCEKIGGVCEKLRPPFVRLKQRLLPARTTA